MAALTEGRRHQRCARQVVDRILVGDLLRQGCAGGLGQELVVRHDGREAEALVHIPLDGVDHAVLVDAAGEGRHELLAIATEDKLHQPYRMPLMPGSKEAFALAKQCGAKAVYVSGAGSTVMAVAERTDAEKFYKGLEAGLEQLEGLDGCEAFTLLRLDADNTGATVE